MVVGAVCRRGGRKAQPVCCALRALATKPFSATDALISASDEEDRHRQQQRRVPGLCISEENTDPTFTNLHTPSPPQISGAHHKFSFWPSPASSASSSSPSSFVIGADGDNHRKSRVLRSPPGAANTISVFWDLDNKPPHSVPPYEAAIRLREVACGFGRLVDMVAYANRHAFSYLPSWVREERRNRKELDRLEDCGLVVPGEPYLCTYCGRRCKTNVALKKHFKQLHERERNKRLNRLESLKGKKKIKYKHSIIEKETRYEEAARDIIAPKVGYGLMQELKRAGVCVKMVSDRPQAADEALMRHILQAINTGINCICLVSDDSDFIPILHEAKARHLRTVVVGDRQMMKMYADVQFSWSDLANGRAFDKATELASMWCKKAGTSMSDLHIQSRSNRIIPVVESAFFPARTHDFKEWNISDDSGTESGGDSDACNGLEKDFDMWDIGQDELVDVDDEIADEDEDKTL